jgi:hypothetical protein
VRAASPLLLEVRLLFDAADGTRKAVHDGSDEVGSSRKVYVIEFTRGYCIYMRLASTLVNSIFFSVLAPKYIGGESTVLYYRSTSESSKGFRQVCFQGVSDFVLIIYRSSKRDLIAPLRQYGWGTREIMSV